MQHSVLVACLVVGLSLVGCGGESVGKSPPGNDPTGGTGGAGSDAGQGSTGQGRAGLGGTDSSGGAGASTGGSSGNGVGGSGTGLPPGNARERELLDPLSTDDATIDAASGRELIELAQSIGLARGYAMCRCFFSPNEVPEDLEELVQSCAVDESGTGARVDSEEEIACVLEGSPELPGFDEYLRCDVKNLRENGRAWLTHCEDPEFPPTTSEVCADPNGNFQTLLSLQCQR
jgi:hypothetical protein